MEEKPEHAAKRRMMELMQLGRPWQEAATMAGVHTSRSTASRWFQQYRTRGEAALQDGRHGHISKMRKPIQACEGDEHDQSSFMAEFMDMGCESRAREHCFFERKFSRQNFVHHFYE
jgi:transposase